jgi:hypothetical protein
MLIQSDILLAVLTFLLSISAAYITANITYMGYQKQAKAELEKEYHSRFNEKKWEIYLSFVKL